MDQEIEKVEARAKQVLTKRGRRQFFDPHVQAGKANVEKVRSVLAGRMAATQAEITRESKVSSGSVTWALRALEKDRAIRPTGPGRWASPRVRAGAEQQGDPARAGFLVHVERTWFGHAAHCMTSTSSSTWRRSPADGPGRAPGGVRAAGQALRSRLPGMRLSNQGTLIHAAKVLLGASLRDPSVFGFLPSDGRSPERCVPTPSSHRDP